MLNPFTSLSTPPALATTVYRSKAVKPLSPPELHELTRVAQARNARESVTGLMLYDNQRFFQWLEGPPDSVDRVMGSIRADKRHHDIEVLDTQSVRARTFDGWTMKLAAQVPATASWRSDVIAPPKEIVEGLRQRPQAAPVLLAKLLPLSAVESESNAVADAITQMPLHSATAAVLKSVILAKVIPQLARGGARLGPAANKRAAELAELLIATDDAAARELIQELRTGGGSQPMLYATLFEPAARSLGDLWTEDLCSEFDVTLGLCRLQNAVRLLAAGNPVRLATQMQHPVVLIAPEPGELHRLGAAMDGTVLRDAGWAPQCVYPADDQALQDIVSATWVDVLDLSLSAAFRREHWMSRVTETIVQARRASQNPAMVVMVWRPHVCRGKHGGCDRRRRRIQHDRFGRGPVDPADGERFPDQCADAASVDGGYGAAFLGGERCVTREAVLPGFDPGIYAPMQGLRCRK